MIVVDVVGCEEDSCRFLEFSSCCSIHIYNRYIDGLFIFHVLRIKYQFRVAELSDMEQLCDHVSWNDSNFIFCCCRVPLHV